MATGMDKLLDHLLSEIALRGVQGEHKLLRMFVVGSECTLASHTVTQHWSFYAIEV
jgi:hypothetical protein